MPNARFRISFSELNELSPSGTDHADFLFSANKQVEPENLAKTASGGELVEGYAQPEIASYKKY